MAEHIFIICIDLHYKQASYCVSDTICKMARYKCPCKFLSVNDDIDTVYGKTFKGENLQLQ